MSSTNSVRPAPEHTVFAGSVPAHYDHGLGPLLFEGYARDLARRVTAPPDGSVLELACGTGIATRRVRAALPRSVAIVATDLNPGMLEHAGRTCTELPNVRFEQADAQDLPFVAGSFDSVLCQFGLMFLPDPVQGLREARRVLRPGGTLLANVWCSRRDNPLVETVEDTVARFLRGGRATFFDVPWGYHDAERITADLAAAGFADFAIETVRITGESPAARDVATGFVQGTPGAAEIRERATVAVEEIVAAVADELAAAYGDRPLRAALQALVITARA